MTNHSKIRSRVIIAVGLAAALGATGVLSLIALWLLGLGNDPLMALASAPF